MGQEDRPDEKQVMGNLAVYVCEEIGETALLMSTTQNDFERVRGDTLNLSRMMEGLKSSYRFLVTVPPDIACSLSDSAAEKQLLPATPGGEPREFTVAKLCAVDEHGVTFMDAGDHTLHIAGYEIDVKAVPLDIAQ